MNSRPILFIFIIVDKVTKMINRYLYFQIVDDIFAFMQSGRMTFSTGFTVLQFLRNETDYYVWYPAISGFGWIRNRLVHLPDKLTEFQANIIFFYLLNLLIRCQVFHNETVTDIKLLYTGYNKL